MGSEMCISDRIKVIDATAGVQEIHQQVLSLVSAAFAAKAKAEVDQQEKRDFATKDSADLAEIAQNIRNQQVGLRQL